MRGNAAVCLALLDAGADGSAPDHTGKTPLHCAKDAAIVELLIDRIGRAQHQTPAPAGAGHGEGASAGAAEGVSTVNATNTYGSTALHRAAFHGREGCLMALLKGGAGVSVGGKNGRWERAGRLGLDGCRR